MGTPNRFSVFLGGFFVANAWSLHAAYDKLTAAVLLRAQQRGHFPVDGRVYDAHGIQVTRAPIWSRFLPFSDVMGRGICREILQNRWCNEPYYN